MERGGVLLKQAPNELHVQNSSRPPCVRTVRFPTLLAGGATGTTALTAPSADLGQR